MRLDEALSLICSAAAAPGGDPARQAAAQGLVDAFVRGTNGDFLGAFCAADNLVQLAALTVLYAANAKHLTAEEIRKMKPAAGPIF